MAFMQRQVQYGEWIEVECAGSTCVFPADLVDDPDKHWDDDAEKFDEDYLADVAQYLGESVYPNKPENITSVKKITGFGARLSAPGYLDCTEWCVFETEEEANAYLEENYGDDEGENE